MREVVLDECVSRGTILPYMQKRFGLVYKVKHVKDFMIGASDNDILRYAKQNDAIVLTRDKRFPESELVLKINKFNLSQIEKQVEAMLLIRGRLDELQEWYGAWKWYKIDLMEIKNEQT